MALSTLSPTSIGRRSFNVKLNIYDDVPDDPKRQLEEEEQQKLDRKKTSTVASPSGMPLIHITSVLLP